MLRYLKQTRVAVRIARAGAKMDSEFLNDAMTLIKDIVAKGGEYVSCHTLCFRLHVDRRMQTLHEANPDWGDAQLFEEAARDEKLAEKGKNADISRFANVCRRLVKLGVLELIPARQGSALTHQPYKFKVVGDPKDVKVVDGDLTQ
jgi:hypothetical protein